MSEQAAATGDDNQLLEARLDRLRDAWRREPCPPAAIRQRLLGQLEALLKENRDDICAAISEDFDGRVPEETLVLEIFPSLQGLAHNRKQLRRWMKPQSKSVGIWFQPGSAQVRYQPLGVAGIIVPWNYPLFLAISPLAAALAAGNRVMIKLSESTPHWNRCFADLVARYLEPGWVEVVTGGPEVGAEFSGLPFDHLLFTGSTAIGRKVMAAASRNLVPVTLELGGKSPCIVGPDFDPGTAASRIMSGKLVNGGQTCIAPDYALVPEASLQDFIDACREQARKQFPDWRRHGYTSIIDAGQLERQQRLLDEARTRGATVIPLFDGGPEGRKVPAAIITDAPDDCRLMQEEIFGPLLPVVTYGELEDAIRYVNARPRPLALYYFGHGQADIDRVLARTVSGGVTVNDTLLHAALDELPFGGVGPSGMGRYHGFEGFRTFSASKGVFYQSRINGKSLISPPYTDLKKRLIRFLAR